MFQVGRLLIRQAARKCLGVDWNRLVFGRSDRGKPYLIQPLLSDGDYCFNISHHGKYVVLASGGYGSQEIGVDVMEIEVPSE